MGPDGIARVITPGRSGGRTRGWLPQRARALEGVVEDSPGAPASFHAPPAAVSQAQTTPAEEEDTMGVDRTFIVRNDTERARLRALVARLSDADLARAMPGGWTVAGVLA